MLMIMMPKAPKQGVTLSGGEVSRFQTVAKCRAARWQGVTLEGGGKESR